MGLVLFLVKSLIFQRGVGGLVVDGRNQEKSSVSYIDGAMWLCLCLHMKAKEREAFHDNDGMGTHDYKGQKSMRNAEKMKEKRGEGSPFLCSFLFYRHFIKSKD